MALYVVRRPFKTRGVFYAVGTLLDDLQPIKYAQIKINEKKIIPIPEDPAALGRLCEYFRVRLGIDLEGLLAEGVSKGSESAEQKEPVVNIPTTPGTPNTGGVSKPGVSSNSPGPVVPLGPSPAASAAALGVTTGPTITVPVTLATPTQAAAAQVAKAVVSHLPKVINKSGVKK